ncbi:MAG TPA: hypothetical protein DIT49_03815 [Clostridiales bacterium]|nr:hypothetical protein [Clostridiales bacterium]
MTRYQIETMARYQIVYIKEGCVPLTTWKDSAEAAHELADSLRESGYAVDVWVHTAQSAKKTEL